MSEPSRPIDVRGQLGTIELRLRETNPELYRHLALYLQVLREVLPMRVEQACHHLATQVFPDRYTHLPLAQRHHLHGRIVLLVHRCGSLLTVEQLACLATQIHRERLRRHQQNGSRSTGPGTTLHLPVAPPVAPPATSEGPSVEAPEGGEFPPGSVRLGLVPPLQRNLLGGWVPGPPNVASSAAEETPSAAREEDDDDDLEQEDPEGTWLTTPWRQGVLPLDPPTLLHWLDGMELALRRRLRNLSHALNVELLRVGLSPSLMPVNLLDAVLSGHLEPMSAPPNLLRLPVPFGMPGGTDPFQAMAVLLRTSDLELEEPRLRTCRRRIRQHRHQVRRMAHHYRLLHRRLLAQEAERLWLQDIRSIRPRGG